MTQNKSKFIALTMLAIILLNNANVVLGAMLYDSYIDTQNAVREIQDEHPSDSADYASAWSQSLTIGAANVTLDSVGLYLKKVGSPTNDVVCTIYAVTGLVGTTAKPTGAALATSVAVDGAGLTTDYVLTFFNFTGGERITLIAGTAYCIVLQCASDGASTSNYVGIASTGAGTDAGNVAFFKSGSWGNLASADINFNLYIDDELTITDYDYTSTFSTGSDGWVNFTYHDADGYADLKSCTIQVNTTGDAETFNISYTQATDTFAETVDADNICTLSEYSTLELVDATHATVAFKFRISDLATVGDCDVYVTFIEDNDNELITLYSALFEFSGIEWGPVGDIIDSAFNVFGITGFMTSLITFIAGLASSFTIALNYTLSLAIQMYNLVASTIGWSIGWVTRMITIMTTLVTLVITLINGTYVGVGALTDIWALFEFSEWGFEFLPIIVLVQWFESLDKRHKNGADYFSTAYNDLNVVYGVMSFFFTWVSFVANTVVDYVMMFVQSLSQVI